MVILSSVHIHPTVDSGEASCVECVKHNCHGHLAELPTTIHACVLCQFVGLAYVAAAVVTVVCLLHIIPTYHAQCQQTILYGVCGIPSLRAPPFV